MTIKINTKYGIHVCHMYFHINFQLIMQKEYNGL